MIYDGRIFDAPASPHDFMELGPYEVEVAPPVARVRIRRGKPVRAELATLSGDAIGKLAVAGAATGTAIAFIIDPAGAAQALLDAFGWWPR